MKKLLSLLVGMAVCVSAYGQKTTAELVTGAAPYNKLSPLEVEMAKVYLLGQLAGLTQTPTEVSSNAAQYGVMSPGQIQAAQLYLLNQISSVGGTLSSFNTNQFLTNTTGLNLKPGGTLPAMDGSALTNIVATSTNAAMPMNVNTGEFTTNANVLALKVGGVIPAMGGTAITNGSGIAVAFKDDATNVVNGVIYSGGTLPAMNAAAVTNVNLLTAVATTTTNTFGLYDTNAFVLSGGNVAGMNTWYYWNAAQSCYTSSVAGQIVWLDGTYAYLSNAAAGFAYYAVDPAGIGGSPSFQYISPGTGSSESQNAFPWQWLDAGAGAPLPTGRHITNDVPYYFASMTNLYAGAINGGENNLQIARPGYRGGMIGTFSSFDDGYDSVIAGGNRNTNHGQGSFMGASSAATIDQNAGESFTLGAEQSYLSNYNGTLGVINSIRSTNRALQFATSFDVIDSSIGTGADHFTLLSADHSYGDVFGGLLAGDYSTNLAGTHVFAIGDRVWGSNNSQVVQIGFDLRDTNGSKVVHIGVSNANLSLGTNGTIVAVGSLTGNGSGLTDIPVAGIAATGIGAAKYLKGDGTWDTPATSGASLQDATNAAVGEVTARTNGLATTAYVVDYVQASTNGFGAGTATNIDGLTGTNMNITGILTSSNAAGVSGIVGPIIDAAGTNRVITTAGQTAIYGPLGKILFKSIWDSYNAFYYPGIDNSIFLYINNLGADIYDIYGNTLMTIRSNSITGPFDVSTAVGSLPDLRLSAQIPRLNQTNIWTSQSNYFPNLTVGTLEATGGDGNTTLSNVTATGNIIGTGTSNYLGTLDAGQVTITLPLTNRLMFATPGGSGPTNIWLSPDGNQTNSGTLRVGGIYATNYYNLPARSVGITIDGGGSAITSGTKGYVMVPCACTIQSGVMMADQSGTISVEVWRTNSAYASYPPTRAGAIGTNSLASMAYTNDVTLGGWTTALNAGDVLGFNVTANATSIQRVTCQLKVQP